MGMTASRVESPEPKFCGVTFFFSAMGVPV